jgi:putative addiction module component (TIGR02574 family)
MEHTAIPDPAGFSDLSKIEQIRYLQALWDRIAEQPDAVPVLDSHLEIAEERLAEYRRDPTCARSAFDVIDDLSRQSR